MNVLVLTTSFPRFEGDVPGRFILDLAVALKSKGHDIGVVCPSYDEGLGKSNIQGIKVSRVGAFLPRRLRISARSSLLSQFSDSYSGKMKILLFCLLQLARCVIEVRRQQTHVINSHWLVPSGLSGALAARIAGKPHILTIHGAGLAGLESTPLGRILVTLLVSRSASVSVVSKDQKRRLLNILSPSSSHKIRRIPMGVDVQRFARQDRVEQAGILFVGRIAEKKGVEYLLRCMSLLGEDELEIAEICGTGPLKDDMKGLAASLGVATHTLFRGYVSEEQLAESYSRCKIVVVPSIRTSSGDVEGVPLVVMESMLLGKVVLATKVGGIVDILEDGKTGLLVDEKSPEQLSKALSSVLDDPRQATATGRRASSWAHNYLTVGSASLGYDGLIDSVVSECQTH